MTKNRSDYHGDVTYEVWRSGGNPDSIDRDRVDEHRAYGDDADIAARHELHAQEKARERALRDAYPEMFDE